MADFLGFCQREPKYARGSQQTTDHPGARVEPEEEDAGQSIFPNFAELFGSSGPKRSIKLDGDTWIVIATDVEENIYLHDVEPFHSIQLKKCSGGCSIVASQAINKLIVNDCKDFRAVVLGAREIDIKDTQDLTVDFRGLYVPTAVKLRNSSRCVLNLPPGIDAAAVETDVDAMHSTAIYFQTADGHKIELTPSATKTVVKGGEAHVIPDDEKKEPGEMPAQAIDQLPTEPVLSTADEFLPVPLQQTNQNSADDRLNALTDAASVLNNNGSSDPADPFNFGRGGLNINGSSDPADPSNFGRGGLNINGSSDPADPSNFGRGGLDINGPGIVLDPAPNLPFSPNLPGRPGLVPDVDRPPEASPMTGDIAGRFGGLDPRPVVPQEPADPTPDVPWYNRNQHPQEVPPLLPADNKKWSLDMGQDPTPQPAPQPAQPELTLDVTDVPLSPERPQNNNAYSPSGNNSYSPSRIGSRNPRSPSTPIYNNLQTFNNTGTPVGPIPLIIGEFQG